jgi:hypothetical protein
MLLWHVSNLHENESAVLKFASKALAFDDMFPLDIKFREQYSVVDLDIKGAPTDGGEEPLSFKVTKTL